MWTVLLLALVLGQDPDHDGVPTILERSARSDPAVPTPPAAFLPAYWSEGKTGAALLAFTDREDLVVGVVLHSPTGFAQARALQISAAYRGAVLRGLEGAFGAAGQLSVSSDGRTATLALRVPWSVLTPWGATWAVRYEEAGGTMEHQAVLVLRTTAWAFLRATRADHTQTAVWPVGRSLSGASLPPENPLPYPGAVYRKVCRQEFVKLGGPVAVLRDEHCVWQQYDPECPDDCSGDRIGQVVLFLDELWWRG